MSYRIIAIERQYGSGGREIAKRASDELGIDYYGQEILIKAAERCGIPARQLEELEERSNDTVWDSISQLNKMFYDDGNAMSDKNRLAKLEAEIIMEIANKEECIFLGRGSAFLLGDRKDTLSVFVYADYEFRKEHAVNNYGIDEAGADKKIKFIDKKRANYYSSLRELMWADKEGYDLMLNSGKLGIDKCIELIVKAYRS